MATTRLRRLGHDRGERSERANAFLEAPIDVERRCGSGVLGEQRRDAPRSRHADRPDVQRAVGSSASAPIAAASRPLIFASTRFDQSPWMQTSDVPAGL